MRVHLGKASLFFLRTPTRRHADTMLPWTCHAGRGGAHPARRPAATRRYAIFGLAERGNVGQYG